MKAELLTINDVASVLNGKNLTGDDAIYADEIQDVLQKAKEYGIEIVYERPFLDEDEIIFFGPVSFTIDADGRLSGFVDIANRKIYSDPDCAGYEWCDCEYYKTLKELLPLVHFERSPRWELCVDAPHEKFNVMDEDGCLHCVGITFKLCDI